MPGTPSRLKQSGWMYGVAAFGAALCPSAAYAQTPDAPRLAGIVIEGSRKVAIFSDPAAGSSTAAEGERVGPFTVASIKPGEARLTGPGGDYILQPSADFGSRSFWVAHGPAASLIDPAYREAVTETDQ